MTPLEQRKKSLSQGIFSLFFGWLIATGFLDIILILGIFISKKWLPLIVLGLQAVILILSRNNNQRRFSFCYRLPAVTATTLFISAIIMIICCLFGMDWEHPLLNNQPANLKIPYISALVIYPVSFLCTIWYLTLGSTSRVCHNCKIKSGSYTERGLVAKLFSQESKNQLWVLFYFSLLLSVIEFIYYRFFYINVNYNSPDIFFYVLLPTGLTILLGIFFYIRYNNMWRYYCKNPMMESIHGTSTALRYLIIVGDYLFLEKSNGSIVDTPVKCFLPFTTEISEKTALENFKEMTGLMPDRLVRAYVSEDSTTLANAFHYLCFYNDESELAGCKLEGQFYSYDRIVRMTHSGTLAPELRSELERIYTVAMAWKTYTPEGKRIYPIKNYRPTFRFRDIHKWDVDYNDHRWLAITFDNEDRRFYKLRRFWRKHVNGVC